MEYRPALRLCRRRPKPARRSALPGLANRLRVKISAPTAVLEYDTRDNVFTPTHGIYSESSYLASREALGASVDFERFEQVLIGWHPLPHSVTVGARANYAWSSTEHPSSCVRTSSCAASPRCASRGTRRHPSNSKRVGSSWAAGVSSCSAAPARRVPETDAFSTTQNVGSGGVGFRYELASKFGMHAGIDVAHSPGTTAVYFVVGNAWFRP